MNPTHQNPPGLTCATCGFGLRCASPQGPCPECGLAVWRSIACWNDPAQRGLSRMRNALRLGGVASIAYAMCTAANGVMVLFLDPTQMFTSSQPGGVARTGATGIASINIGTFGVTMLVGCITIIVMAIWWLAWLIATTRIAHQAWPQIRPAAQHLTIALWSCVASFALMSCCGGIALALPRAVLVFALVFSCLLWTTLYLTVRFVTQLGVATECSLPFASLVRTLAIVVLIAAALQGIGALIFQPVVVPNMAALMSGQGGIPQIPPTPMALRIGTAIVQMLGALAMLPLALAAWRVAKMIPAPVALIVPLVPPRA